jgi:hypothetical protein
VSPLKVKNKQNIMEDDARQPKEKEPPFGNSSSLRSPIERDM